MTSQILRKMRRRDRLAKNSSRRNDYKQLRNEIVKDCRKAERSYLKNKIEEECGFVPGRRRYGDPVYGRQGR